MSKKTICKAVHICISSYDAINSMPETYFKLKSLFLDKLVLMNIEDTNSEVDGVFYLM